MINVKKIILISLTPLCLLAGIGLFELILLTNNQSMNSSWHVLAGIILGLLILIVEYKNILKCISNL